jgi:hypothetical protein
VGSFLASLLGGDSALFDFNFFDVLAESVFDGLDDIGLVGLEGVEISSPSDFELGDLGVLLDEDNYINDRLLFLATLALPLAADLLSFSRVRKSLGDLTSLG